MARAQEEQARVAVAADEAVLEVQHGLARAQVRELGHAALAVVGVQLLEDGAALDLVLLPAQPAREGGVHAYVAPIERQGKHQVGREQEEAVVVGHRADLLKNR